MADEARNQVSFEDDVSEDDFNPEQEQGSDDERAPQSPAPERPSARSQSRAIVQEDEDEDEPVSGNARPSRGRPD